MSKSCFNCKHCYNKSICTLFEELVEDNCSCFMWNGDNE